MNKTKYIIRRLGLMLFSLWAVITVIFLLFRTLPGDPATIMLGPGFSDDQYEAIAARHGLDEPLYIQYVYFMRNLVFHGDLGVSFQHNTEVLPFVLHRTLNTLSITMTALIAAFIIGPIIGSVFAWKRGEKADTIGTGLVLSSWSTPMFWLGMLALIVFSYYLGWFPTGGMRAIDDTETRIIHRFISRDFLWHATLPFLVYFLRVLSQPTLFMRNNMIEVKDAEFIELKRAEGIPSWKIQIKHAARNSLLPVLHYGALAFGLAFGGSIILEVVFSWPGIGYAMYLAVQAHDYPIAQAAFFVVAAMVIFANFVVDLISVYIDPRVSLDGEIE